ncbi:hypothetical protein TNCV_2090141 [Trichonephila clavipes]|nr:hypothetical protein TNCV_2090141 [Trichonephila clavipes]
MVLPEPAEFRCTSERILLYEADTKRSNVSICRMQDDKFEKKLDNSASFQVEDESTSRHQKCCYCGR